MDNTESSDSVYVNTEELENPIFIENREKVATSSSLPPPLYLYRGKDL